MPLSKYMQQRGLVTAPTKTLNGRPQYSTPRNGKSLGDAVLELGTVSKTEQSRMASAEVDVSKLIAAQLLKDVDIKVSLYDGAATELVEDYEKYKEYESQQESETERIKHEIEERENSLPETIKRKEQELKDEASSLLTQATNALSELQRDMENKVQMDRERIQEEIDDTLNSYQTAYDETLKDAEDGVKEIYDIMKSLNINAVNTKDFVDVTPEIEELISLAKTDAEMIQKIRDSGGSTEVFQELAKLRESKIQSSVYLPSSVVALPALAGYAVLNMAKNFMDLSVGKKYIKELEKEIQLCFRLAVKQINEFKTSYCLPDVSELQEQLKNVKFITESSYKDSIRNAEREVEEARDAKLKKEQSIASILRETRGRLEAEAEQFKNEGNQIIRELRDNCKKYKASWEEKRCKFEENQTLPNFEDRTMLTMLEELCPSGFLKRNRLVNPTTIDKLRLYNEYEVLEGLSYQDKPKSESDEDIAMYKYDQELLGEKDAIKKKLDELMANGEDKETVTKKVESLKRGLDHYYAPTIKGLHSGSHVLQRSVINALENGQEYFKNNMDNTSFLFVYDRNKEGDEEYLANYIKYQVQQILANYHPDALKVNIINPTYGSAFNNLQVFLDKIDENTGAPIPGRDFCRAYTNDGKIDSVFKEIADKASRVSESADAKYTCEELVYDRRLKGAVTPQYNINILYNVPQGNKFKIFNNSSKYLGIINIYLLDKSSVLTYDADKGEYKVESAISQMLSDIGVIGESVYKDDEKLIYLTNIKSKQITRFVYESRSREEENRVCDIITDKALAVKKPVTVTEEFLNSIPSVKENGYWAEDATKICKLYFGYVDGDESKPYPVVLNEDDSVHMFIGGTTGGGKSNLLAVMVNCLKMMYPPSQLEVIYFDFKVVEVAIHSKPYKMPHCSAMSGTSAPEYLISLFSYCTTEMMRRYDLFKKWNVVKLSNLIKVMKKKIKELRAEGKSEEADRVEKEIPKRLVIIIDEAAQAFQLDDQNAVERVKITLIKLAQLARAAGVHMILVSQDPNKMPSEVLTLLKLRGCTKADVSISKAILHESDIAARAENQFIGFFAVSTNKGEQFKSRYVVPLNDEETTRKFSKIAYDKAKKDINRNAVTFDENDTYTYKRHKFYLDSQKREGKEVFNGMNILLGEPVYFQQKFKPLEIKLVKAEKQNIGIVSGEDSTKASLFRTITECIEPYADFMPVYCKAPPSYAQPEYFIDKATKDDTLDSFMMFLGKNAVSDDKLEEYRGIIGDISIEQFWAGEMRTKDEQMELNEEYEYAIKEYNKQKAAFESKVASEKKKWETEHPGEPYKEPEFDEEEPKQKDIGWSVDFQSTLKDIYSYRRSKKITKPLYVFIFDMDQHDAIIQRDINWNSFSSLINTANTTNIHILYFSDKVDIADRNMCRYVIAGNLPSSVTEKQFKNINVLYCKVVNTLNDANSALFKPIVY